MNKIESLTIFIAPNINYDQFLFLFKEIHKSHYQTHWIVYWKLYSCSTSIAQFLINFGNGYKLRVLGLGFCGFRVLGF